MGFPVTLVKALVALVPVDLLVAGSLVVFSRRKTVWSFVQLLGAAGLVVVVLTHVAEALGVFPWMHWGEAHSAGHYLDLSGAVLGATFFPVGYFFEALTTRRG